MNISETMASIRWMMEKHLGKYENQSDELIALPPPKEQQLPIQRAPLKSTAVIEALRRYKSGQRIKDIAALLDSTPTTISKIVHRRGCYADLPATETNIKAFLKSKGRE